VRNNNIFGGINVYIIRFSVSGGIKYGVLEGEAINGYQGNPFSQPEGNTPFSSDGSTYKLGNVKLLAPYVPSKIIGLGLNYRKHAEEANLAIPAVPLIFLKPSSAVVGPDENIVLPRDYERVEYEGELGVVIGKTAKDVLQEQAKDYILGYTCFNDVSYRNNQKQDGQWARAKGYDTFAPMGPCISTYINGDDLKIETYLNGELKQSSRTRDLIFGISELISFISAVMTLLPGDVIATGTPFGTGTIKPGDVIEIKIENIGTLRNYVVAKG
jgi:2-keto-4-pentenoate hydratase/2-oxohepta-3-ene-1,7-dioic acid hydratase in catechol pathway